MCATSQARTPRGRPRASGLGQRPTERGSRLGAVRAAGIPDRSGAGAMTTAWSYFWWVVLPYVAMAVFVIGHIWRWRYDQFGWTSRSTQLQERGWLKWGSPLFHYGTFAAIGGHVMGILIPARWTTGIGISPHAYHVFAASAGLVAAVLVIGGMAVLAARRVFVPRVRATTGPVD